MSRPSNISRRRSSALSEGGADYSAKREQLVAIAARLFREQGFKATRLLDIAREAELDRATMYYYVGSKEELFQAVVEGVLDANLAEAERLMADASLRWSMRLRLLMARLMASYDENFPSTYVYIQENMHQVSAGESAWEQDILTKTRRFEQVVMLFIREAMAAGELRRDIPVRLVANAIFGMFNWTHRWYAPGGPFDGRDIAQAFVAIFFDGMKPTEDRMRRCPPEASGTVRDGQPVDAAARKQRGPGS